MRGLRAPMSALLAMLLMALPGTAVADRSGNESGQTGAHHLVDTADTPGAWCGYTFDDEYALLYLVRVQPPVVFARDRTTARDAQRVGWRVVLTALDGGGRSWVVATSRWRRATAWDDSPAAFTPRIVPVPHPDFMTDWPSIRAWVQLRWYAPDDPHRVVGSSDHGIDFHLVHVFTDPHAVSRCPWWGQP